MSTSLTKEFWDRTGNVTAGMLSGDGLSPRPMAHQLREDDGALWFITAKQTDVADAAAKGAQAQHVLACSHGQIYAAIDGTLTIETDEAILDDIWSPMAAVWFDDGREDDDICLVRFTPSKAEVWATDGGAKALFEFAKASLSDDTPDMGEHGVLRF
ncbi:pyridoxamine 5'-phosphate oxidase family protein [Rhodobacteraceae bacterium KMM 6894]|nr:pyridoxamine 5'-phosphate oxidase family protein [Rhodobacteraceae bacterium KMM 6894]